MSELILHHYPPSPVSEKVRVAFGIKRLGWRSVEIPRLPPRPLLFPMSGGYRRTPVMQVGADVYCDSSLILDELERRHPEPSLFPDGQAGLARGLARWLNGPMFDTTVAVVLGAAAGDLPPAFARDRVALYFGADASLDDLAASLPTSLGQLRVQLGWLDDMLGADDFFCGQAPGLRDALAWYLAWFLDGRYAHGRALIDALPRLAAWYPRMEAMGHGHERAMAAEEALALCAASEPLMPPDAVRSSPEGLAAGVRVSVTPEGRGMDPAVTGELVALDDSRVSLHRRDPEAGDVVVHFPRVGYRLAAA